MTHQTVEVTAPLTRTVLNWHNARHVFSAFIAAHPELGMRDSPITFRNFCYRHGRQLRELDVMRKPSGLRASAIFDSDRFDEVAFNILSLRYRTASLTHSNVLSSTPEQYDLWDDHSVELPVDQSTVTGVNL